MDFQMNKFIEIMRLFLIGAVAISLFTLSRFIYRRTWEKLDTFIEIVLIILWLFFSIYVVLSNFGG